MENQIMIDWINIATLTNVLKRFKITKECVSVTTVRVKVNLEEDTMWH